MKKIINVSSFLLVLCINVLFVVDAKAADLSRIDTIPLKTTNANASSIISAYINSIGGADAVKKIKTVISIGTMSIKGMSMDFTQKLMEAPYKMSQVLTWSGQIISKTVINGVDGYSEQMGNRVEMTKDQIASMRQQTSFISQIDYISNPNYKLKVLGIEKVNNSDAYNLQVTQPSGVSFNEYYDVISKLLIRQSISRSVNGQNIGTVNLDYSDYKKVGGLLMPFKLSISGAEGSQSLGMTATTEFTYKSITVNEGVTDADFQ